MYERKNNVPEETEETDLKGRTDLKEEAQGTEQEKWTGKTDLKGANSEEVNPEGKTHVIHLMEEQQELIKEKKYGGTIRLGAWPCKIEKGSVIYDLYKKYDSGLYDSFPVIMERHRHRYEFNNDYREKFEKSDFKLSGKSPDDMLVEAIELPKDVHPFFVGTQYHPELKSRFLQPHPLFMGFIEASLK